MSLTTDLKKALGIDQKTKRVFLVTATSQGKSTLESRGIKININQSYAVGTRIVINNGIIEQIISPSGQEFYSE